MTLFPREIASNDVAPTVQVWWIKMTVREPLMAPRDRLFRGAEVACLGARTLSLEGPTHLAAVWLHD
jgi:hypothetical protein